MVLAPGYPSQFSLEVLQMVAEAKGDGNGFGPWFMVRKADGAVVGAIGARCHRATATAQVGYTVVEPSWGHGYATAALRALLAHLLADRRAIPRRPGRRGWTAGPCRWSSTRPSRRRLTGRDGASGRGPA